MIFLLTIVKQMKPLSYFVSIGLLILTYIFQIQTVTGHSHGDGKGDDEDEDMNNMNMKTTNSTKHMGGSSIFLKKNQIKLKFNTFLFIL